jgi:hypothetical protein
MEDVSSSVREATVGGNPAGGATGYMGDANQGQNFMPLSRGE